MSNNFRPNLTRMDRFCLRNGSVADEEDDLLLVEERLRNGWT
jgi:hypothetical protein